MMRMSFVEQLSSGGEGGVESFEEEDCDFSTVDDSKCSFGKFGVDGDGFSPGFAGEDGVDGSGGFLEESLQGTRVQGGDLEEDGFIGRRR